MAIIRFFCDESGKHKDHPVVTFCGVAASQPKLQQFDDAWDALLRQSGLTELHMKRASEYTRGLSGKIPKQAVDERIEALKPFADCINNHLEIGLIQAWDVKGFNALSESARRKLGGAADPYYTAFIRGLMEIVDYVHEDDRISVVCDDDEETALDCYRHYRGVRKVHPAIRQRTVSLTFANDKYFPALQAADMVAFLSRHQARKLFYNIPTLYEPLRKYLVSEQALGRMQWIEMFADEAKVKGLSKSLERSGRKKHP